MTSLIDELLSRHARWAVVAGLIVACLLPAEAHARPVAVDNRTTFSVACPSVRQCTVVDTSGREVTFNPRAPRRHRAFMMDRSSSRFGGFDAVVACPTTRVCTAEDALGNWVTFDPQRQRRINWITNAHIFDAISCPSASQCTVADFQGSVATFNPLLDSRIDPVGLDPAGGTELSLSCPTVFQCTAVSGWSGEVMTFAPQSPGNPARVVIAPHLAELSCPSAAQCTALVPYGAMTFDPRAPRSGAVIPIERIAIGGLACPTVSQCTVFDALNREVTFNPLRPGHARPRALEPPPRSQPLTGNVQLYSMSCPAPRQCTAIDDFGREMTFNPRRR